MNIRTQKRTRYFQIMFVFASIIASAHMRAIAAQEESGTISSDLWEMIKSKFSTNETIQLGGISAIAVGGGHTCALTSSMDKVSAVTSEIPIVERESWGRLFSDTIMK